MPWWNWLLPWKWVDLWRGPVSDPEPAQTASPVATSKAPWLADTSAGSSEAAVAQTDPTESSNTDASTSTEDQQTSQELQELQDQIAALQDTVQELEQEVEEASDQQSDPQSAHLIMNNQAWWNDGISPGFEYDRGIERGKANERLAYSIIDDDGVNRSELENAFIDFIETYEIWSDGYSIDLFASDYTVNGEPAGWDITIDAVNPSYLPLGHRSFDIQFTDALGNEETMSSGFGVFLEGTGDEFQFTSTAVDNQIFKGETAGSLSWRLSSNVGLDASEVYDAFLEAFSDWEAYTGNVSVTVTEKTDLADGYSDTYLSMLVTVTGDVATAVYNVGRAYGSWDHEVIQTAYVYNLEDYFGFYNWSDFVDFL